MVTARENGKLEGIANAISDGYMERTITFIRVLACHFDFPCLSIVLPAELIPNSNQLRPLQQRSSGLV
jgi:hypothetical protein